MSLAQPNGPLSGLLSAGLMGQIFAERLTGSYKLDLAAVQRAIYFREGRILFCSSNATDDQLGQILVASGKISQVQLKNILESLGPKKSIASGLAESGLVTQRDIGDAARKKVEQIVAAVLSQETGTYQFEEDVLPKGALDLKLTTEKLMLAAMRTLEPSGFANRILGSPLAVLSPLQAHIEDPEFTRLHVTLDGTSNLADVASKAGVSPAEAGVVGASLVLCQLAEVLTSQIEDMNLPPLEEVGSRDSGSSASQDFGEATLTTPLDPQEWSGSSSGSIAPPAMDESTLLMDSPPEFSESSEDVIRVTGAPKGRQKPSVQELDAVRELLKKDVRSQPTSLELDDDPQRVLRGRRPTGPLAKFTESRALRIFAGVAGAAVLGALGLVAWSMYNGSLEPTYPPLPPPRPTSTPLFTSTASPAPALPVSPSPVGPHGTPVPAPSVSPSTPNTPAPASSSPSPVSERTPPKPSPTAAASATQVASSGTTPAPTVTPRATVSPTAKPAPTATPDAPSTGSKTRTAYELLKASEFEASASASLRALRARGSEFAIQLIVACDPSSISKAMTADASADLFVVPVRVSGRSCYRLLRGVFKTKDAAAAAVDALPQYYRSEGATPKPVPVSSILK